MIKTILLTYIVICAIALIITFIKDEEAAIMVICFPVTSIFMIKRKVKKLKHHKQKQALIKQIIEKYPNEQYTKQQLAKLMKYELRLMLDRGYTLNDINEMEDIEI